MKFSLTTLMAVGVIGFICGMSFVIVISCLIISSEESRREENETN